MPLISVVIPVYNNEDYICACVDSIINQDFKNIEIILVDDGSTDKSADICDEYATAENIKAFHMENMGVSFARNKGISETVGDYIWFVDSDDTVAPDSLRILADAIKSTNADFISFGVREHYIKSGHLIKTTEKLFKSRLFDDPQSGFSFFQQNNLLDLVADKICKRSVIVDNNIAFDQANVPTEDHIFWLTVYPKLKKTAVIEACLYNYYLRDNNSSTKKLRYYKFPAYSRTLTLMIDYSKRYGVFDEMSDYLYRCYCYYLLWEFEILSNRDCKFGLFKRYKYFKKAYKTNIFSKDFKSSAIDYYFSANTIKRTKMRDRIIKELANNKFLYPALLSFAIRLKFGI